ncbi:MAG TPA: C1 family peptidase [Fimbriiglobus sp.]
MSDLIEIVDGGEVRRLGTLAPAAAGPVADWPVFGTVDNGRLIPRSQWKPVSLRHLFPTLKDQNGVGMCNCAATGNVVEGCRRLASLPDVPLSAGDLYRRVCGGVDRGSLLEDALKELMAAGMAPEAKVPYLDWRHDVPSAAGDRLRYRITEAVWCPTFDHVASALQQGFLVDVGIWWFGSDPLDADGWLQASGSRGRGGHAVCACELAERNGQWGVGFVNSWGPNWGKAGFGILPEARVEEGCRIFQAWACRAVVVDETVVPPLVSPNGD